MELPFLGNDRSAMSRIQLNQTMTLPSSDLAVVIDNKTGPESSQRANEYRGLAISLSTPIIMMSTGVLGNLLALSILFTADRQVRRTSFFPLLLTMACTDLTGQAATGTIAIIVYANNLKWVGGRPLCLYHGFAMVFLSVITPLLVCSMSIERLLALTFSYFYQRCFTHSVAKIIIAGSLTFTMFFCTWPLMGFGSYELQFPGSWCFLNYHKESVKDVIYALVFSCLNIAIILVIIVCNAMVVWTLLKMRRLRPMLQSSPPKELETQMVWFLLAITVVFSCLWLPINVHILKIQITGEKNYRQDLISVRLASINQIIDPWLYVILRKNTFLRFLSRIKKFITRDKTPRSSSAYSRSATHLHTLKRVPRRQSCPPAVYCRANGDLNQDKALDQLLPGQVAGQSMLRSRSVPNCEDVVVSHNGPLNVLEEAGLGLNMSCENRAPMFSAGEKICRQLTDQVVLETDSDLSPNVNGVNHLDTKQDEGKFGVVHVVDVLN